ncbi:MAG: NFACT RNA binding domain-containing protein [Ignavibacteria bacterium]|nr:NFACT RNA binding domain-containing protein [Ignavibacteria bacterium]
MLNNYFTLKSQDDFLNSVLPGSEITDISTHANNRIVISLRDNSGKSYCLFISLERNCETLFIEENISNPKSNVYYFFDNIYGNKIRSIEIRDYDRVIYFRIDDNFSLVFSAIPMKANLFLVREGVITDSFRDKSSYLSRSFSEVIGRGSTVNFNQSFGSKARLNKNLSFLGKYYSEDFLISLKRKGMNINEVPEKEITDYINCLITDRKYLIYTSEERTVCALKELSGFRGAELITFNDSNSMVRSCYYKTTTLARTKDIKKNLLTGIDNKISKLEGKIRNLKSSLENTGDSENLKHLGDLILSNIHLIIKGSKSVEIEDYNTGSKVKIKLKENFSPSENAGHYYSKFKGFKNSADILKNKIDKYELDLGKLVLQREKILQEENPKNIFKMEKNTENTGNTESLPFRIFKLTDKFEVWVGKSSASNDLLTMKYARQYDLWFHARGSSGSHTVLRLQDKNDIPDKETIKKAASIAAYYSKARKGKHVPVAYCERKYVKKRKGMNQGAVTMEKEKVIFADPELPG